jgi:hypothetical protein
VASGACGFGEKVVLRWWCRIYRQQGCPRSAGPQVGCAGWLGQTRAWLRLEVRPGLQNDMWGPSAIETLWEVPVGYAELQRSAGLQSSGARATR